MLIIVKREKYTCELLVSMFMHDQHVHPVPLLKPASYAKGNSGKCYHKVLIFHNATSITTTDGNFENIPREGNSENNGSKES